MLTYDELKAKRDIEKERLVMGKDSKYNRRVLVGYATCGISAGAVPVLEALKNEVAESKIDDALVTMTGCIGICQYEPIVEVVEKDGTKTTYVGIDADKAKRIVKEHLAGGKTITELTIGSVIA